MIQSERELVKMIRDANRMWVRVTRVALRDLWGTADRAREFSVQHEFECDPRADVIKFRVPS